MNKNKSEQYFEEYLNQEKISFCKICTCNQKRPDYRVTVCKQPKIDIICEVKEFQNKEVQRNKIFTSKYPPGLKSLREKIKEASNQFAQYKSNSTLLVLCNPNSAFVDLSPEIVIMAMFGDIVYNIVERKFICNRNAPSQIARKANGSLISAVAVLWHLNKWKLQIILNPSAKNKFPYKYFQVKKDEVFGYKERFGFRKIKIDI